MRSDSERRARTAVAQLELVSHAPVASLSSSGGGEDGSRGGRRPPGGVDRTDDVVPGFGLRSHERFIVLLRACRSADDFDRVADAALRALESWRHAGRPPADSEPWQELVGREAGSVREVAARWNVSPTYVHQLRKRHAAR